ncbi:1035_t:CDS:2 [Entrophospora sp. SA101]|nr:1035_t:CDS:2 [Entrophospora sp. SA101]
MTTIATSKHSNLALTLARTAYKMEVDNSMDIDDKSTSSKCAGKYKDDEEKPRFEVKKWNAVALWAWGD